MEADYTYYACVSTKSPAIVSHIVSIYAELNLRLLPVGSNKVCVRKCDEKHLYRIDRTLVRNEHYFVKIGSAGKAIADTAAFPEGVVVVERLDESMLGHFGEYNVRFVESGDRYGLHDQLVWSDIKPIIEFYRMGNYYDHRLDGRGYFVSRYYLETLMERGDKGGLCLDSGLGLCIEQSHLNAVLDAAKHRRPELFVRTA